MNGKTCMELVFLDEISCDQFTESSMNNDITIVDRFEKAPEDRELQIVD